MEIDVSAHCGQVTTYNANGLDQYWSRQWLVPVVNSFALPWREPHRNAQYMKYWDDEMYVCMLYDSHIA